MNKEEKIKIRIQQLQAQSDYNKFEYTQLSTYFIGIIAILIAVYIPVVLELDKWYWSIILLILLASSIRYTHRKLSSHFKKNVDEMKKLSIEIDKLYKQLLK